MLAQRPLGVLNTGAHKRHATVVTTKNNRGGRGNLPKKRHCTPDLDVVQKIGQCADSWFGRSGARHATCPRVRVGGPDAMCFPDYTVGGGKCQSSSCFPCETVLSAHKARHFLHRKGGSGANSKVMSRTRKILRVPVMTRRIATAKAFTSSCENSAWACVPSVPGLIFVAGGLLCQRKRSSCFRSYHF